MLRSRVHAAVVLVPSLTLASFTIPAIHTDSLHTTFRLNTLDGLEIINVKAEPTTYRGKPAVRLLESSAAPVRNHPGMESLALLKDSDFRDGSIEVEIAGAPRQGAAPDIRGFVGIAFRSQDQGKRFECFYVRFTNGRSDDQLRRNHSVQYISSPEFPWERLRKETPGVYESYADLEVGAWTSVKIVVAGTKARLYINGADQPCLIVNDLKLGDVHGPIGLWVGADTEAYFANLAVK